MSLPPVNGLDELGILFALLPGLLTYLVKHTLVSRHEALSGIKVVMWGLAYTLVVWSIWELFKWPGAFLPTPDLVGLSACAVSLGAGAAFLDSSGLAFKWARRLRLTHQPVFPSVWRAAFHQFRREEKGEFAVLHLRDGRRLYGAVVGISPTREKGHVFLQPAAWLPKGDAEPDGPDGQLPSLNPAGFLIPTDDVAIVEFVPPTLPKVSDGRSESEV